MGSGVPAAPPEAAAPSVGTEVASPAAAKSESQPKSFPRLPGVIPDDGIPLAGPKEPAPTPSSQPGRDASGRFVKADATPPAAAEDHTLESRTEPVKETEPPLEQKYKSLQGQFKPVMGLAKALGGIEHVAPKFQEAVQSANGWKAQAEAYKAELDTLKGGKQPASEKAVAPEAAPAEGINWELYAKIKQLANEQGVPEEAEKWLVTQQEKVIQDRVEKLLAERLKPFEEEKQADTTYARYEQVFGTIAAINDASGKPAYPELSDPAQAYEVGKIWAAMDLPKDHAMTEKGVVAAVALHRMIRSFGSQEESANATLTPGEDVLTDTAAAAALSEGKPTVVKGREGSLSTEAANIVASLRSMNAGSKSRATLGFEA